MIKLYFYIKYDVSSKFNFAGNFAISFKVINTLTASSWNVFDREAITIILFTKCLQSIP